MLAKEAADDDGDAQDEDEAGLVLVNAVVAIGLNLLSGFTNQLSFGHAAFFGVGAYTAGLLAVHGWGEPSGLAAAAVSH